MRILKIIAAWAKRCFRVPQESPDRGASGARWLAADATPLGIPILDCSEHARSMVAFSGSAAVAQTFVRLRNLSGEELRGQMPERLQRIECHLEYRFRGEIREARLFTAEQMEDKWDITLLWPHVYYCRSWTGQLVFRATAERIDDRLIFRSIDAGPSEENHTFIVRQVDFLNKTHVLGLNSVFPLPRKLPDDLNTLTAYAFSMYGRRGLYGAYSEDLGIHSQS